LGSFYPAGDFYVNDPNPVTDGFFVEAMLFNTVNPETGAMSQNYKWTGSFNDPNVRLGVGQGAAVWIDKAGTDYDYHTAETFHFPKDDPFYYLYNAEGQIIEQRPDLDRSQNYRFIYEPADAHDVGLAGSSTAPNEPVLVGNPFMSHLDFDLFFANNSTHIEDEYKLAYGVATSNGKVSDFATYKKIGDVIVSNGDLDEWIAPMQSFMVVSKSGSSALKANITQTGVKPGASLRGAERPEKMMRISAERDDQRSSALLLHLDGASSGFVPAEDSRKLFSSNLLEPVMVYTRSSDGYALDINSIGDYFENPVALGVRTSVKGPILLSFEGVEDFRNEATPYLVDVTLNTTTNLLQCNDYMFIKEEDSLYVDNRFYVRFLPAGTEITALAPASFSVVNPSPLTVRILSTETPQRVRIWDISGNILIDRENPQLSDTYHVNKPGVYIVRITSEHGSEVKKTIIR
jgi:hypothetical protein